MPKTLFHFFSPKTGKKNSTRVTTPASEKKPLQPINGIQAERTPAKKAKLVTDADKNFSTDISPFEEFDIVWAKIGKHPWWPGIVSKDPVSNGHLKLEEGLNLVHVDFFSIPCSHGWVDVDFVDKFTGSQSRDWQLGGRYHSTETDVIIAVKKADEALKMEMKERKTLMRLQDDGATSMDSESEEDEKSTSMAKKGSSSKMAKKRRCIASSSDESCDEFVPATNEPSSDDYESDKSSTVETESSGNDSPEIDSRKRKRVKPVKSRSSTTTPNSSFTKLSTPKPSPVTPNNKSLSSITKSRLSLFKAADESNDSFSEVHEQTKYLHETLEFLFPENIRDKRGKKASDADYDPTTLKVPSEFFKKLTPAMFQWWTLKAENFDVILCFKVGKFYELYHTDAVVGVNELGLVFMKGNFAHSGFPEIAFSRYSETLVNKGYKVARVEQTETPEQNAIRVKKNALPKQQKTLRREICRIVTKGTQCLGPLTRCYNMKSGNNFLLAVIERQLDGNDDRDGGSSYLQREFGVCFVDTSVGVFHVGQFKDDRHCSSLCTMICRNAPCQVLYEKGRLSCAFKKILKSGLSSTLQEALNPGTQFWHAPKTIACIRKEGYFTKNGEEKWPDVLKRMMKDADAVSLCAAQEYELAFSALGACIFYLQKCLFDREVLSLGQFEEYRPHGSGQPNLVTDFVRSNGNMVLDSVTLHNLEILENSLGGSEDTLLDRLDSCHTAFGKRLMKQWLCSPPCNPDISNDRLDAIDDLENAFDFVEECGEILKAIPDLERMLMKIHALSKGCRNVDHPENRAVFYEEEKYSKKNIEDFLSILKHYETFHGVLEKYQDAFAKFKSKLLRNSVCFARNSGQFPDLKPVLDQWKTAFDHKKALESGKITPNKGANPEYDKAIDNIRKIQKDLELYLRKQKEIMQCPNIVYKGTGNKRYLLEMPVDAANRVKSSQYVIAAQRKGFKSFRTPETAEFLKSMEKAEAQRDSAQADTLSIIFREFDQNYSAWRLAIDAMSVLDVMISFVQYCRNNESEMCRPVFKWTGPDMAPFLEIRSGKHPSMSRTFFDGDFIPNDTVLGGGDGENGNSCLVLTGPNMGGKSTLMRQVGLMVVLAHVGCRVPAASCVLSPVDRVFTRLGASDRILSGESTFHVEMSETSSILRHATVHSLVLLDELGRGTATYDGSAIASAVVREISSNTKCRTIFSTHYHSVVDDLKDSENAFQGHMACMVENDDVNEDPSKDSLTFLYKLADGPCPKSYGFHAARLAELPESVISLAYRKAGELERDAKDLVAFGAIHRLQEGDVARDLAEILSLR